MIVVFGYSWSYVFICCVYYGIWAVVSIIVSVLTNILLLIIMINIYIIIVFAYILFHLRLFMG